MSTASPEPSVQIRRLQPADRHRWGELWRGYLAFYKHDIAAEVTEFTWRRLMDGLQLHGFAAVDENGRVVGFVHYHVHPSTWSLTGYCYLEDLFVDPGFRGRRAGRALIEAVYRAAQESGASRVYWHTENTNARAQTLYNQLAELTPFLQYRHSLQES